MFSYYQHRITIKQKQQQQQQQQQEYQATRSIVVPPNVDELLATMIENRTINWNTKQNKTKQHNTTHKD